MRKFITCTSRHQFFCPSPTPHWLPVKQLASGILCVLGWPADMFCWPTGFQKCFYLVLLQNWVSHESLDMGTLGGKKWERSGQYWTCITIAYQAARVEGALLLQAQVFSPIGLASPHLTSHCFLTSESMVTVASSLPASSAGNRDSWLLAEGGRTHNRRNSSGLGKVFKRW